MRKQFGKTICDLAEQDSRVILVAGDIGFGIFDEYKKRFSDRFINLGICEQSMIGIASGMALEGLRPYVYTITPFLIERPFEQIKLDINQQRANVTLVGYADYPHQGPTHSEIDARRLMALMENIRSYFPRDSEEARINLLEGYKLNGPVFISLKQNKAR